jgi:hypothetical protein
MAPPKVGAPRQTSQKTHNRFSSLQETTEVKQEFAQREGIINVDAIPSPQVEPVSATLLEKEEKAPMMVRMEIDLHDNAQGHELLATGNPQQPAKVEAAHRMNDGNNKRTDSNGSRPQPMVGSTQQEEVQIEDITSLP